MVCSKRTGQNGSDALLSREIEFAANLREDVPDDGSVSADQKIKKEKE